MSPSAFDVCPGCMRPYKRHTHILLPHRCSTAPLSPGQSLSWSSAAGTQLQCPAPPGSPPHRRRCLGLAILTRSGCRKNRTQTCLRGRSQGSQDIFCMVASGHEYNNVGQSKQMLSSFEKKLLQCGKQNEPQDPAPWDTGAIQFPPLEGREDTPMIMIRWHYMAKVKAFYRCH